MRKLGVIRDWKEEELTRKRRTRQHVIADMAVNRLEWHALCCGFATERISQDYGVDVNLYTYSASGELENSCVYIQSKATESPKYSKHGDFLSFAIKKSDLETWLNEPLPLILAVYDARIDKAYWVYIQQHFESLTDFSLNDVGQTCTIRVDTSHVVDKEAILQFAAFKESVLGQIDGVIKHV